MRNIFYMLLIFSLLSCGKYINGGIVLKADENIIGSWILQDYIRDDYAMTHALHFTNYIETYYPDSSLIIQYTDSSGIEVKDTGIWFWTDDQRFIHYEDIDSVKPFLKPVELINNNISLIPSAILEDVKILKLTPEEFGYIFYQNTMSHEFVFIRQ